MKKFELGSCDPSQYNGIAEEEKEAWHTPSPYSYHSYHVERMGENVFRIRDSSTAHFYVGTHAEAAELLLRLRCRKPDLERIAKQAPLRAHLRKVVTDKEIEDLFKDLI